MSRNNYQDAVKAEAAAVAAQIAEAKAIMADVDALMQRYAAEDNKPLTLVGYKL